MRIQNLEEYIFALNQLPLTDEFLLGDYVSKFESKALTELLRRFCSLKIVCEAWNHMQELLVEFLEMKVTEEYS